MQLVWMCDRPERLAIPFMFDKSFVVVFFILLIADVLYRVGDFFLTS